MGDTIGTAGSSSLDYAENITVPGLCFDNVPPIGVLGAHLKSDEEDSLKATLRRHGAQVTTDVSKTKIFIGKVGTRKRAEFELRSRKFEVEELLESASQDGHKDVPRKRAADTADQDVTSSKKVKQPEATVEPIVIQDDGSTTEDEGEVDETETEDEETERALKERTQTPRTSPIIPDEPFDAYPPIFPDSLEDDLIWVVRIDWLNGCLSAGHLIPLGDNLVYEGKVKQRPPASLPVDYHTTKPAFTSSHKAASQTQQPARPRPSSQILDRAKADATTSSKPKPNFSQRSDGHGSHRFLGRAFTSSAPKPTFTSETAHLLQQTTSEYEGEDTDIPPPPAWVEAGVQYACQRFTPADPPNADFIAQLKKIRTARTLIDDDIGVRAYSSIIASVAAYPHKLGHPREVLRLPNCDEKTAVLFVEWKNTGRIQAVEDYENDEVMQVLRTFYDIWGVGAKTARAFYYNKGWHDLDDIIEFGWNDLDRVQQIGVKYYDEFLEGIPRAEVESIADVVRRHAVKLRDERISVTIVGGYRRGKAESGDVDLIVSHPELEATAGLVQEIVHSLETEEWITHTLTMSLNNTSRGQTTLPFRTTKASGAGFDTLDKALVVWQDSEWPEGEAALAADAKGKNPNVHRRVDIIVAPWRTVGCAVMGWSGGTTFQRDLRRYAKYVKGWKFDSSGIRSRETGEVVQLEGPDGVDGTAEDAEKAVFEGLGLEYIPPEMRCTN